MLIVKVLAYPVGDITTPEIVIFTALCHQITVFEVFKSEGLSQVCLDEA